MEYQVKSEKNWRTVIEVTVPADEIQPQLDEKYKEYQKHAKIGGFRKGKVPMSLIRKMFGKEIETEVFEPYFSQAWRKIVEEKKFEPISAPGLGDVKYDPESGLSFTISFDVKPEFEVKGYEGMQVEKEIFEITDEDVEEVLERVRQDNAMIYTVEGEAQEGHYVVGDWQELDRTGVPMVGRKYENQTIFLKEGEEVTRQLIGAKAGEERRVVLGGEKEKTGVLETAEKEEEIPEQFYLVEIKEIKERRVPELDDEFAKDMGEFDSLEALRADVKERLEKEARERTEYLFRHAIIDEIIKIVGLDVPESMLENYLDSVVESVKKDSKKPVDEGQIREYYKPAAMRNLKWMLISHQLVEQEGITVSDEELEARIEEIEKSGPEGEARAKELRENEEKRENLKDDILEEKVLNYLASKATINEIKKPWRQKEEKSELEV